MMTPTRGANSTLATAIALILVASGWMLLTYQESEGSESPDPTSQAIGQDAPQPMTSTEPEKQQRPADTTATTGRAAAPATPVAPKPGGGGASGSTTTTTAYFQGTPGFPLEVDVTPACARRGETISVAMKTRPGSATTAAAAYSNGQAYNTYTVGQADQNGVWKWSFVVPPNAPVGRGTVIASAGDRRLGSDGQPASSGEYANTTRPFEIKDRCP